MLEELCKLYKVVFLLYGDMKFIYYMFGLQGTQTTYPCAWCYCFHFDLNCFLQFPERGIARTQSQMAFSGEKMDKLLKDAKVDEKVAAFKSNLPQKPGKAAKKSRRASISKFRLKLVDDLNEVMKIMHWNQRHVPIFNIGGPMFYIIDTLHLKLRLVEYFVQLIEVEIAKSEDPAGLKKKFDEKLAFFSIDRRVTGFIGSEASKLVNESRAILADFPTESRCKLVELFDRFHEILSYFSVTIKFSQEQALCYKKLCLNFGQFINAQFPSSMYSTKLYLHALVYHSWYFLWTWGNLGIFSTEGLESLNAVVKHVKHNHTASGQHGSNNMTVVQLTRFCEIRNSRVVIENTPPVISRGEPTCSRCKGTLPGAMGKGAHRTCRKGFPVNKRVWPAFSFPQTDKDLLDKNRMPIDRIPGIRCWDRREPQKAPNDLNLSAFACSQPTPGRGVGQANVVAEISVSGCVPVPVRVGAGAGIRSPRRSPKKRRLSEISQVNPRQLFSS
jgi:hypothetical protein